MPYLFVLYIRSIAESASLLIYSYRRENVSVCCFKLLSSI